MPEFDSSPLLSTLRTELRAAWATIHAAHARDGLYGFGVYTTDSASYLMVTAFSDAGLEQAVAKYVAKENGPARDPALMRESLRWSPCDSPLHAEGSALLPESDRIVQDLDAEGARVEDADDDDIDIDDDDDDDYFDDEAQDPAVAEVFRVAVQALQEMDREGLFGIGAQRERVLLCVWKGDQSNVERYDFAKALNPPAAVRSFGEQMNAGTRAFYRAYMPDEELPEDDVFE